MIFSWGVFGWCGLGCFFGPLVNGDLLSASGFFVFLMGATLLTMLAWMSVCVYRKWTRPRGYRCKGCQFLWY